MLKTTLLSCLPGFLLEEHSLQTQLADAWQGCWKGKKKMTKWSASESKTFQS